MYLGLTQKLPDASTCFLGHGALGGQEIYLPTGRLELHLSQSISQYVAKSEHWSSA